MKTILITGARGFIGKNLMSRLKLFDHLKVLEFGCEDDSDTLHRHLEKANWIVHLAGVNRPKRIEDFQTVNLGLTQSMVEYLSKIGNKPKWIFASAIHAERDDPYGRSKKQAEDLLLEYNRSTGSNIYIFRLTNLFGKWSRPNYNSVVATFCHNISRNLEIWISDRNTMIGLSYIDDVVDRWLHLIQNAREETTASPFNEIAPVYKTSLGELADTIHGFRKSRRDLFIPDLENSFTRRLYSTYLSYLDKEDFSYELHQIGNDQGILTELLKSKHFGQIFISTTKGGKTRGNHYHHSKAEKFCVVKGRASIKLRHLLDDEIIVYPVSGEKIEIVDIPAGYTHSIANESEEELIVLFWADQPFDRRKPDTYFEKV